MLKNWNKRHRIWGISGISYLMIIWICVYNYSLPIDDDYFPKRIDGYFMCSSPKVIELNIPDDFEVWITRDSIRDISFFKKNLTDNDNFFYRKTRVGHIIEVNLIEADTSAQNFSIHSLNSDEQILDRYDPATWKWKITPLRKGIHNLVVVYFPQSFGPV